MGSLAINQTPFQSFELGRKDQDRIVLGYKKSWPNLLKKEMAY